MPSPRRRRKAGGGEPDEETAQALAVVEMLMREGVELRAGLDASNRALKDAKHSYGGRAKKLLKIKDSLARDKRLCEVKLAGVRKKIKIYSASLRALSQQMKRMYNPKRFASLEASLLQKGKEEVAMQAESKSLRKENRLQAKRLKALRKSEIELPRKYVTMTRDVRSKKQMVRASNVAKSKSEAEKERDAEFARVVAERNKKLVGELQDVYGQRNVVEEHAKAQKRAKRQTAAAVQKAAKELEALKIRYDEAEEERKRQDRSMAREQKRLKKGIDEVTSNLTATRDEIRASTVQCQKHRQQLAEVSVVLQQLPRCSLSCAQNQHRVLNFFHFVCRRPREKLPKLRLGSRKRRLRSIFKERMNMQEQIQTPLTSMQTAAQTLLHLEGYCLTWLNCCFVCAEDVYKLSIG